MTGLEITLGLVSWLVFILAFGLIFVVRLSPKASNWFEKHLWAPRVRRRKPRPQKWNHFASDGPTDAEITMRALSGEGAYYGVEFLEYDNEFRQVSDELEHDERSTATDEKKMYFSGSPADLNREKAGLQNETRLGNK